jgi:hypothetical protein
MIDHRRRLATQVWLAIARLGRLNLLLLVAGCEQTKDPSGPADVAGPGPGAAVAERPAVKGGVQTSGGGTTSFGQDLDGNGAINLSHFGFTAVISGDGSAHGHFMCLMAGNAEILGLKLMAVQGPVTFGSADGTQFGGTATVKVFHAFGNGRESIIENVSYSVVVAPGGAGVGTLEMTVYGVFDGVAGDVVLGNGNYDLAKETLRSGRITIH